MGEDNQTAGIELPDDLTTVDDRGLTSLKDKILKQFDKLKAKDKKSAADLDEMRALRDQMRQVNSVEQERQTADAENRAEADAIIREMSGEGEGEAGDGEGAGDGAEGDGAGDGGDAGAGDGDGGAGEGDGPGGEGGGAGDGAGASDLVTVEALAASFGEALVAAMQQQPGSTTGRSPVTTAPRPSAAELADASAARNRPRAAADQVPTGFNIVASSDTPGVPTGSHLTLDGLGDALTARARAMGVSRSGRGDKAVVASIEKAAVNDVRSLTGRAEIQDAWDKAHDVQENLVASGGWCGPTENIYDFACDFEVLPDEVDLPTLTTQRAGVNVPDALLLGDLMGQDGIGMQWTEAMDIAAADPEEDPPVTKVCFTVPCPDWDETTLEAIYTCVKAGNLADRSFPEGTARTRDLALLGHAHRLNAAKLTKMEAAAVSAGAVDLGDLSAAEAVLAGVEFVVARTRDVYFMSADQVLEVVLPRWVKDVMRRDLARRAAVDFEQVTDETIRTFFSEIGARVQFVTNWHPLVIGDVAYPASVVALVYPAGAFTLLDGGQLDIAVIRDSVLNATNDHTLLFFEEFWELLNRCAAYKVTIPLCPRGGTGIAAAITCPTA